MRLAEVAAAVGGQLHDAEPDRVVAGPVVADSREVVPGALFVALRGDHVDGHAYAEAAVASGAVAVLSSRPVPGVPCVVAPAVADGYAARLEPALAALGRLARAVLDRLPGLTVVGVTGSQGKTTTKDLLAQVLAAAGPTVSPEASLNNELGVPLTVLRAEESTAHLVLEMSARGVGHIRYLTEIAPPRVGVVLNVGLSHVGEFGSRDLIATAKGELVEALPRAGGVAVLNLDDPRVAAMTERTDAAVVGIGVGFGGEGGEGGRAGDTGARADVRAEQVTLDPAGCAAFRLVTPEGPAEVRLRLVGAHQVVNALAAAAVARAVGLGVEEVATRLSQAERRARWRMEVTDRADGVTVVNDAYNASPDSMRAALETLRALATARRPPRRTWAILGEMLELGAASRREHAALGTLARQLDISRVIAVGDGARPIWESARDTADARPRAQEEAMWVPDTAAALEVLRRELAPGDVVLVKSSRDAGLRHLGDAVLADAASRTAGEVARP